ncbi:hypothetical protein Hanom_Chr03g00208401 [Helianthus anomalus]
MHFEILCHAVSYEPSLIMFLRFSLSGLQWALVHHREDTMSAFVFIMLEDPSIVDVETKEDPASHSSIIRHTKHVRTEGDLSNVQVQPVIDASMGKKAPHSVRRSTRGTSFVGATSQSSDPIFVNSGDEDDVNVIASMTGINLVKTEVVLVVVCDVGGTSTGPSKADISAVLRKLNEGKLIVEKET